MDHLLPKMPGFYHGLPADPFLSNLFDDSIVNAFLRNNVSITFALPHTILHSQQSHSATPTRETKLVLAMLDNTVEQYFSAGLAPSIQSRN